MGRVTVTFDLMNYWDVQQVNKGLIPPDRIRKVAVQGVVDTGATRLVLPTAVAEQIGLPVTGQTTVRYADHRREKRDIASDAFLRLCGRGSTFNAVLEPNRTDALVGAIVMEDLDLIVDCARQQVVPRDPHTTVTEVE